MKIGITILATDQTMPPAQVANEAEARGFYSFYVPEHTHIPTSRITPAPTGTDELGEEYKRILDPYIGLATAAEATENIQLGTGVSLILQHHPISLAKTIATLSQLSRGRFVLGVGYGWNKEEMAHHNVKYENRREMLREWLLGMYELWGKETGEFHGEFLDFSASWAWPKPHKNKSEETKDGTPPTTSRPKVLIGGAGGTKLFQHIAELADGWMPIGGSGIKERLPELKKAVEDAGRDFNQVEIVPYGVVPTPEKLEFYETIGITEAILRVPGGNREEVLPALDQLADFLPN